MKFIDYKIFGGWGERVLGSKIGIAKIVLVEDSHEDFARVGV